MNTMETRKIGALSVSVVGLGCNNFGGRLDTEGTAAVVQAALDAGVNFFDTADIYGGGKSEEYLGRALGDGARGSWLPPNSATPSRGRGAGPARNISRWRSKQACGASAPTTSTCTSYTGPTP